MKKNTSNNPEPAGWTVVLNRVLILTLLFSAFMQHGWYQPKKAEAAITTLQAWSNIHNLTSAPGTISYPITATGAGARMLIVAVSGSMTVASATRSITLSYGGQTMTKAATNETTSSRTHTWLFYLQESGIQAISNSNLVFAVTNPGTSRFYQVDAAVYDGVDQSGTPLSSNQSYLNNGTASATIGPFAANLVVGTGNTAVEIVSAVRYASTTPRTVTMAANWSSVFGPTALASTDSVNVYIATDTTAGNTTSQHTASGTTNCSMSAMSLKAMTPNLTIGNGTNPLNATVMQGVSGNAMNAFTLGMSAGSATINTLTLTGSAQFTSANVSAIHIYRDNGTLGILDGADVEAASTNTWATNVATITLTSAESVTTTANYLVVVDVSPGAVVGNTLSGTITAASGGSLGTPAYSDASSATLTIALATGIVSCAGCHGYTTAFTDGSARNVSAGIFPGSHNTHVVSYGKACSRCHSVPATETSADFDHRNSSIDMANPINGNTAAAYSKGTISFAQTTTAAFIGGTCSSTYCHSNGASVISGSIPANTSPAWGGSTDCGSCHGTVGDDGRPDYSNGSPKRNTHGDGVSYGVTHKATPCTTCHAGIVGSAGTYTVDPATHNNGVYNLQGSLGYSQATGSCSTPGCHGGATWGGLSLTCTECHNAIITTTNAKALDASVTTRRNIVAEMKNTWSHKRSSAGGVTANTVVTKWDCIVCHMEGDPATGGKTGQHGDGYIDLRDPDTGTQIKVVTGFSGSPGSYTSGATDMRFVRFSRNLSVTLENDPAWLTLAAIQMNQCLKCHDANGALSASAWVPATGTALKPFGVAITGQVVPYNINGNGNVVNVSSSFTTTNASYHPVTGRQNNSYVQGAQMIAPWSSITKTNGNNTSYGALMSCWDCHATLASTGTITSTVTAHGNAVTLRGPIRAAGTTATTNLCVNCHATKYATVASAHGSGSAFTSGSSNMGTSTFNNCSYCHGYGVVAATYSAASVGRPLRAEEGHGFNDRIAGTVGSKWTSGARPYAFIRNTLSNWAPTTATGDTITNPHTCSGTGGTCNNNMNNSSFGLGGVY